MSTDEASNIKVEPINEVSVNLNQNFSLHNQIKIEVKDETPANLSDKIWEFQNDFEYIENSQNFICEICGSDTLPGAGIILKNCLHEFCKNCLSQHIEHSQEIEISCPFVSNNNQRCEGFLDDREVRNLVTEEIYRKHLEKSIKSAENQSKNSFHCKKINCPGWIEIVGHHLRTFECSVCKSINCIKCQAAHGRMTCWQFKATLMPKGEDLSVRYIKQLVKNRKAMRCSKCGIVIEKTYGCNHMTCGNCKNEFIWTGINK
jgi:RanBP-type and C3HC4-type zinc finger-containing protein 1